MWCTSFSANNPRTLPRCFYLRQVSGTAADVLLSALEVSRTHWHFRPTNWRCKPTDRICILYGIVVELIILIPLDTYIYIMTLLRLFALMMEGFLRKITGFWALCTCALSRMCGLKPMFFVSLNSTSQPQNFPILTPDASDSAIIRRWNGRKRHFWLRGIWRYFMVFSATWKRSHHPCNASRPGNSHKLRRIPCGDGESMVFLGIEFFDTNLWDLNKNVGKHRKTLGILCH